MARSDLTTVGGRIRWVIEEKLGLKQAEFARRVGETPPQLSRWVMNRNLPNDDALQAIATTGGVEIAWLRYGGPVPGSEERPEDVGYQPGEGQDRYDPEAETAEMLFGQLEKWIRGMGGEGDPAQAKLRRLDSLEGLRRFFSARGPVPDWWYDIKRRVEDGEL